MGLYEVLVILVLILVPDIKASNCGDVQRCPRNEHMEECAPDYCEGEYCPRTDLDMLLEDCPEADPGDCSLRRCMCKDGMLRNATGDCILASMCPPIECTQPNEYLADYPVTCPGETCDQAIMNPARCALRPRIPIPPKPTCRCIEGYYRIEDGGECVEYSECPPMDCPSGEYLDDCPPQLCAGQYCPTSPSSPRSCPSTEECGTPKCMCNFNTRRNRIGTCIPISKCPAFKCDGPNEEYQACPPVCPGENCTDYLNNSTCPKFRIGIVVECKPTCRCKKGFYRNEQNICVQASQCKPPGCNGDPNAHKGCGVPCNRTCKLYNKPSVPCSKICKPNSCDCNSGYVLNETTGQCVLPENCPKPPGCNGDPNAHKGCGVPCNRTCKLYNKPSVPCSRICKQNSCDCNSGYVLNEATGQCVLPENCPKECNQPNEEYSSAFDSCPPQTCRALIDGVACTQEVRPPQSGCRCKKNFYRNYLGACIASEDCYKCRGPHEYFSCGSACDNVCETLATQNQTNCPIINIACNRKCYCEKEYARNKDNRCIPIDQCERKPPGCNGDPNAHKGCGVPCNRTCKLYNKPSVPCSRICKQNSCDCNSGYVLNEATGQCVLPENCPKEEGCNGDPNAQPGCGVNCGNTCKQHNKKGPIICEALCKVNGCDCKKGYVLNEETGKCILPEQCPKEEGCNGDPNAQPGCGVNCGNTCKQHNKGPIKCEELCKVNGCDCKKGYVLNEETGKCILPEQCPKECNQPNEEYSSAFDPCLNQTCRELIDGVACTQEVRPPQSGCRCKKNFYRNYLGECIASEDCRKCPGEREFFSCGGACDNICETLAKRNQTHCDIINIVCNRMCYCEKGYARNNYGVCVPIDQCGPVRCPGDHEALACGVPCDNVCATLSKQNKTNCPDINKYKKCTEMCYCDDGYARDKNKQCVLYDDKCDGK